MYFDLPRLAEQQPAKLWLEQHNEGDDPNICQRLEYPCKRLHIRCARNDRATDNEGEAEKDLRSDRPAHRHVETIEQEGHEEDVEYVHPSDRQKSDME